MDNKVIELLNKRFATRAISSEPIPEEIIDELVEAARLTPSCYNQQPWRFLILESAEARDKGEEFLGKGNQVWALKAPLLIIGYAKPEDDCIIPDGREYFQFDLGLAVMNLILSATCRGLVARPMAGFEPDKVKSVFGLEKEHQPMVVIAVGYPSEDESHLPEHYQGLTKKPRQRKEAGKLVKKF